MPFALLIVVFCLFVCQFRNCFQDGTLKSDIVTNEMLPEFNKVVAAALAGEFDEDSSSSSSASSSSPSSTQPKPLLQTKVDNLSPVIDFLEGKHCLTGVSSSCFTRFASPTKFKNILKILYYCFATGIWLVEIRILLWPLCAAIPCG